MVTVATRERAADQAAPRQQNLFITPEREQDKALDNLIEIVVQRLRELQARAKLTQTHESRPVKVEQLEAMARETAEAAKLILQAVTLAKAREEAQ